MIAIFSKVSSFCTALVKTQQEEDAPHPGASRFKSEILSEAHQWSSHLNLKGFLEKPPRLKSIP